MRKLTVKEKRIVKRCMHNLVVMYGIFIKPLALMFSKKLRTKHTEYTDGLVELFLVDDKEKKNKMADELIAKRIAEIKKEVNEVRDHRPEMY